MIRVVNISHVLAAASCLLLSSTAFASVLDPIASVGTIVNDDLMADSLASSARFNRSPRSGSRDLEESDCGGNPIRIHSGSDVAYTDPATGLEWQADNYFSGGNKSALCDSAENPLHCTSRQGVFYYEIPVASSDKHSVTLSFYETEQLNAGDRIQNIHVNEEYAEEIDIAEQAGGHHKLLAFKYIVRPQFNSVLNSYTVTLDFLQVVGDASLSAIEIIDLCQPVMAAADPVASPNPTPAPTVYTTPSPTIYNECNFFEPIRLNCGPPENITDEFGVTWYEDKYFTNDWDGGKAPCHRADDPRLLCTRRQGQFRYEIPVSAGCKYNVRMQFYENVDWNVGDRLFNILAEGKIMEENVDLIAMGGGVSRVPLEISFLIAVDDDFLNLEFIKTNGWGPLLSTLEVIRYEETPEPTLAPTSESFDQCDFETLRINCGPPLNYTDESGVTWYEDKYFTNIWGGGKAPCQGDEEKLMCYRRQGDFSYNIPVAAGCTYMVTLKFYENVEWHQPGDRLFSISAEGEILEENVDLVVLGGNNTRVPVEISFLITVADETLDLDFLKTHGWGPILSAIEVIQFSDTQEPTSAPTGENFDLCDIDPIRINCGPPANITDDDGVTWYEDKYFKNIWGLGKGACNYDDDPPLLCNRRQGEFTYNIPVVAGCTYSVQLGFYENVDFNPGDRLFNIVAEGQLMEENVDLILLGGNVSRVPLELSFLVTVSDESLDLEFIKTNGWGPLLSTIEVIPFKDTPQPTSAPTSNTTESSLRFGGGGMAGGSVAESEVTLAPSLAPTPVPAVCVPFDPIRINCGPPRNYTDENGNTWYEDKYYDNQWGGPKSSCEEGESELLCTRRQGQYDYHIPVPEGCAYVVNIQFYENMDFKVGERLFDVFAEDQVEESIDLIALGLGFSRIPLETSFFIPYSDGTLDLKFRQVKGWGPVTSSIEVLHWVDTPEPTSAPTATFSPTPAPTEFTIRIRCGYGEEWTDSMGRVWGPDKWFKRGWTASKLDETVFKSNPVDEFLYRYGRMGRDFEYIIPLPTGTYEIKLHMIELYKGYAGARLFDLRVEDTLLENIDPFKLGGGYMRAFSLDFVEVVADGNLNIIVSENVFSGQDGVLNGIEIYLLGEHLAHAVAGGPYKVIDTDDDKQETVHVSGSTSHTHGDGLVIQTAVWAEGKTELGTGLENDFVLPVGEHVVTLTVIDDGGNEGTDQAVISVMPFGYPSVFSLSPAEGSVEGNEEVIITGSGFTFPVDDTVVTFAGMELKKDTIEILNSTSIKITKTPTVLIARDVEVTVTTPKGESDAGSYKYVNGVPIAFEQGMLASLQGVARVRFGPDGCLYAVTTSTSLLAKYELKFEDDGTVVVLSTVKSSFGASGYTGKRYLMGIAFDPLDPFDKNDPNSEPPAVYVAHSSFFHKEARSTFGQAVNGMITKVTGANLDVFEDIITGLPVSDHDHGINGIEFDNNGQLYVTIGSNTNSGIPGALSSTGKQKENYLSAAVLVADLTNPDFNGVIKYTAEDDGTPIVDGIEIGQPGYNGPEVYAHGLRNPVGIVMHSNGELYCTDNGPNIGYGDVSTGCDVMDFVPDVTDGDEVNHLLKGRYYGHPNKKRAAVDGDPQQCVRYASFDSSEGNYKEPLAQTKSSTNGIIDYHANHFNGQLRGNLVMSEYNKGLRRVVLTPDGTKSIADSHTSIVLSGEKGLDVTQAPNGMLFEARYELNEIWWQRAEEPVEHTLKVNTCWPHRGPITGGKTLSIFGYNFGRTDDAPVVTVGGEPCTEATLVGPDEIECILPPGTGLVDVTLTKGGETSTFQKGYRYISGLPE